jgi:hypothetical protein
MLACALFVVANTTDGRQYGFLVPFYDGRHFVGKIVRVDLMHMIANATNCSKSWRMESKKAQGVKVYGMRQIFQLWLGCYLTLIYCAYRNGLDSTCLHNYP